MRNIFSLISLQILAVVALSGCIEKLPSSCVEGCIDVCTNPKSGSKKQCVSEYLDGYNMGYQDGFQNKVTDGFNTDAFVAGYWDGEADGKASRY